MVKNATQFYSIKDWRKDNPVESDILELISAAHRFAISHNLNNEIESGNPSEQVKDECTELELAITRATLAVWSMMDTREGRKAAGLKPKGRGRQKMYDPEMTVITDPQVQIVLKMLREQIPKATAYAQIAQLLGSKEDIDQRTLKNYVLSLADKYAQYVDPRYKPFLVADSK